MSSQTPKTPLIFMVAVTAIISLGPLTLNIFLPSMPGLVGEFGVPYDTIQLGLTLFLAGLAIAQLVYGQLSDVFGRRPVLLFGLMLFLAGTLICMLAPTVEILIFGRVVQALGGGAGLILGRTIVRDLFDREQTASRLAYVNMGMVVAPMLAPALGGYLDAWFGWRANFVLVLILGAAVTIGAWRTLHETKKPQIGDVISFAGSFASIAILMRMREFRGYAFQGAFSVGVFFAFVGGAPYVMVELMERPASEYGLYFIGVAAMYMSGNFIAGKLSPVVGVNRMITLGSLVALAAATGLCVVLWAGWLQPWNLFLPMALVGLGNGMSVPNSLAGVVSVDPSRAGAAAGFSGFLQMTIGAVASYIIGLLLADSAWPMVVTMFLGAAFALAAHLLGQRGNNSDGEPSKVGG